MSQNELAASVLPSTSSTAFGASHPATPLLEVLPGVLGKFECNNPGGSHKVRAARYAVSQAVKQGMIVPHKTTVIEKTGGNFGFGLTVACREIGVDVELAVGLGFSAIKRRSLAMFGASLIGIDMMEQGASPREVVEWHLGNAGELGKQYYYTDQFNNPSCLEVHELQTGPELVAQLRRQTEIETVTFVSCAGTGASLTGIGRSLIRAGYDVRIILVEPEGCDSRNGVFVPHRFEGMSVGVKPPFVDWDIVSEVQQVPYERMIAMQRDVARATGYYVGFTTAACLAVAEPLGALASPSENIVTLIYDHGLWYPQ